MNYLSTVCPTYEHEKDGWVETRQHDEIVWDDMNEFWVAADDPSKRMVREGGRPAVWWSVAVYTSGRAYGGPEEGGWWYDCGELTEHHKIQFFNDYYEAVTALHKLWDWCTEENKDNGDTNLVARGFTEQMPEAFYPKKRPYYC